MRSGVEQVSYRETDALLCSTSRVLYRPARAAVLFPYWEKGLGEEIVALTVDWNAVASVSRWQHGDYFVAA